MKKFLRLFLFLFLFLVSCSNDVSVTPHQEEGIDEADIVKISDDGYIFKAQSDGVTVSKIDDDGKLSLFKKRAFTTDYKPKEMLIYNNEYIIVINALLDFNEDRNGSMHNYWFDDNIYYENICVQIYNYKNTDDELSLVREDFFPGTYKTSRLYIEDENFYLVTNYKKNTYNEIFDYSESDEKGFLISRLNLTDINSKYLKALYNNNVYDVYFSQNNIYSMVKKRKSAGCLYSGYITTINVFSLETLQLEGSINDLTIYADDRYSLHEKNNYLFIVGLGDNSSSLVVYEKETLSKISDIKNIAPGEDLKSVRFDDSFCYIVTFLEVDPLFKIDISNPLNPTITGELKIEGYSSELHKFGDDLLIGIGYAANRNNLKVTLFEVFDNYPTEVNSIELPSSTSEALKNQKAVLSNYSKNIFAFPVSSYNSSNDSEQGVCIFGLKNGELQILAYLSDIDKSSTKSDEYNKKKIARIHYINDYIILISEGFISSYNIEDVKKGEKESISFLDTRIDIESHTITFETFDENITINAQIINDFVKLVEPKEIVRDGKYIAYWYRKNENVKYNFDNIVTGSFTLYAKWEDTITNKITFMNGEKVITVKNYIRFSDIVLPDPIEFGFEEKYWIDENNNICKYIYDIDNDFVFYLFKKTES